MKNLSHEEEMTTYVSTRDDHASVLANSHSWADHIHVPKETTNMRLMWNDNKLITLEENEKPVNPYIEDVCPLMSNGKNGRGLLGRWGVNHAADPLITYLDEFEISHSLHL